MTSNSCLACASTAFSPRETSSPAFAEAIEGRQFVQPAYRVRCCAKCGLYSKDSFLSPAELMTYYSAVDFRKWENPGFFPTERAVLKYLRGIPDGSKILDYGCSTGRLLSSLTSRCDCNGFEINHEAARQAAKKGLRMWSREEFAGVAGCFDVILLVDVFEHLPTPLTTLRNVCGLIKPNGKLVLVTGNVDAPYCQKNPALFWYFRNIEHVCMMGRSHASYLERVLGLRLDLWEELCHYDVSLRRKLKSHIWNLAYWGSRPESPFWLQTALSVTPILSKAKGWEVPLGLCCTRDHVLAAFTKL
jgi:SAM-dependent methyltransferase